ncbi:MAG: hypothetical protein LBM68_00005, partial [Bacteroidales bacterium]|nr:hypothetical protein [Bacteroidales bacterium]
MILQDTFFTIQNCSATERKADYRVQFNAEHCIYKAHFPNNPITPGVCLVQIARELFNFCNGTDLRITTLKNIKFTAPINPLEFPEVDFLLEFTKQEHLWQVKVVVKEHETIFAKMSLILSTD